MTPGASLFWSIFLGPIKKVKRGTSATRGLKTRRKKRRGGIHPRVESTQQPLSFRYQSTAEIYSRQVLHTTICHCFVRGPRSKISVPPPPSLPISASSLPNVSSIAYRMFSRNNQECAAVPSRDAARDRALVANTVARESTPMSRAQPYIPPLIVHAMTPHAYRNIGRFTKFIRKAPCHAIVELVELPSGRTTRRKRAPP